jgi:hypothetical protein
MDNMRDDLGRELQFWSDVERLDLIASIIHDSGERFYSELAREEEHSPQLSRFERQLRVKLRLIETDSRGGPELATWFAAALQ